MIQSPSQERLGKLLLMLPDTQEGLDLLKHNLQFTAPPGSSLTERGLLLYAQQEILKRLDDLVAQRDQLKEAT